MNSIDPNLILALRGIEPLVNEKVLMEAALEMQCPYDTAKEYLMGNIENEKFGKELLEVLKIRIAHHYSTIGQSPLRHDDLIKRLTEHLEKLNKRLDEISYLLWVLLEKPRPDNLESK